MSVLDFVDKSVCLFVFNSVGMLLQQPVMAGPQTDREKTTTTTKGNKQTKTKRSTNTHKSVQKNNDTIQNKKQKIVIMYYTIYTVVL